MVCPIFLLDLNGISAGDIGAASALVARDADDDAQDMIGLSRVYKSSGSSNATFTRRAGAEGDMGRRKEGGIDSGERVAMDENVRRCTRERGCERGRGHGACVPDVVGVAGMLVSRDADDDVQEDMVGLGRTYKSSGSSNAGVKSAGVDADAGEGRDCEWENGEL